MTTSLGLPGEGCQEEILSSFHVYRSNREISIFTYLWYGTEVENALVPNPGHVLENIWNVLQSVSDEQV